jgi:methyl-accepting chemotaxis protein
MVSILLAECRDTECQIDIHMYYFVAMAILAIYCDWQVVLAAAAATILHHFVMNTVAPNLVFPDGSDLRRVGLHAVVVVFEAGALMWMGQRITTLFAASAEHLAQVKAASQAAAEARAELDARRQAADRERQARLEEVARQIRTVQ